jgi:hypothetical protein
MPDSSRLPLRSDQHLFFIRKIDKSCDITTFSNPRYQDYQDFLQSKAFTYADKHVAATYVMQKRDSSEIVAYFAIMVDIISLDNCTHLEHTDGLHISALKIYRLAASQTLCNYYYGIAEVLLDSIAHIALELSEKYLPIRFLTLDADEEYGNRKIVDIYTRYGFISDTIPNRCPDIGITMVYDLYSEMP